MNVVVNARGVSKGGGTPPFGQHGLSSDRPSAGRVRGGDRRIARRKSRESRVTVRLSEGEAAQLARVKNRYGLSESGAIRAAIDYLDGAPEPKVVNRNVLLLTAEVNAIGVNLNQMTRQGWAGIEPDVDEFRREKDKFLALVKEWS